MPASEIESVGYEFMSVNDAVAEFDMLEESKGRGKKNDGGMNPNLANRSTTFATRG